MADFPGYEPRTAEEKAYVEATYEGSACPERAPPGRELLQSFIARKLTPRQVCSSRRSPCYRVGAVHAVP